MNRQKWHDFFLLLCVYFLIMSFPFEWFIKGENRVWIIYLIRIVLSIGFTGFVFWFQRRNPYIHFFKHYFKIGNFFLLLPTFLICGSNFLYLAFVPDDIYFHINYLFVFKVILTLLVALNEEMLFRGLLLENLEYENKLKRIALSALLFGFAHISRFLAFFNPVELLVMVYTAAIGFVLGFIFEYSGSLFCCVMFHFLFNFVNSDLFDCFSLGVSNFNLYILISASFFAVFGLYLALLYFFHFKKEKNNLFN